QNDPALRFVSDGRTLIVNSGGIRYTLCRIQTYAGLAHDLNRSGAGDCSSAVRRNVDPGPCSRIESDAESGIIAQVEHRRAGLGCEQRKAAIAADRGASDTGPENVTVCQSQAGLR